MLVNPGTSGYGGAFAAFTIPRTAGLRAFDEAAARLAGLAGQWGAGGNCGRLAHGEEAEDMYLGF